MAGVAIYLASRAGDYVVGNTIAVDGGVVYASAGLEIAGDICIYTNRNIDVQELT